MESLIAGSTLLPFVVLVLKLAREVHDTLSSIRNVPKKVASLIADVRFIGSILERLSVYNEEQLYSISVTDSASLFDLLYLCHIDINDIAKRLSHFVSFPAGGHKNRLGRIIYAAFNGKSLEELRTRIYGHAIKLDLYLNIVQARTNAAQLTSQLVQANHTVAAL